MERRNPTAVRAARAYHARCRMRFRLACLGFALAFVLIGGRLVSLGLAEKGPGRGGSYDISTTIHRPDILDRNGELLATDIRGATLFADPKRILDADEVVTGIVSVLPKTNEARLRKQQAKSRPATHLILQSTFVSGSATGAKKVVTTSTARA